jgi:hypothetical protein
MRQRIGKELGAPNLEPFVEELVIVGQIVGNIVNLDGVRNLQVFGTLT